MREGLETRIGWIVLSEFVVLVPKLRLGKENDKSFATSSYLKKINIIKLYGVNRSLREINLPVYVTTSSTFKFKTLF